MDPNKEIKKSNFVKENQFYSFNIGQLPKGCQLCVLGRKTVIYITGICPRKCFYCPLSEQKKDKDVIYANELKTDNFEDIIEECKLSSSIGAGITGGDPLAKLDRTIKLIKRLKKEFGTEFHLHLYTSLNLISENKLKKLYDAGLDEIRVHPDLEDKSIWGKIKQLKKFNWNYGIEIPMIPGFYDNIKNLIQIYNKDIQFINLNEFEYSDTNNDELHKRNFYCRDEDTYAIENSLENGQKILLWIKEEFPELKAHLCTAKLKDATQIANRFKLRSKNIAKDFDIVDDEGMIIRGAIKVKETEIEKVIKELIEKFEIPEELIEADFDRTQILIAPWILEEISKEISYKAELITEYPTSDRMLIESIPLN